MIPIGLALKGVGKVVGGVAKKIPLSVWLGLAGVVAFWGWGHYQYNKGTSDCEAAHKREQDRQNVIIAELRKDQGKITIKYKTVYVDRVKVIHEKAKVIHDLIPNYIPADSCDLPPGFRVLHDAAATNTIPGTAEGINAAPVPVRTATETISDNYESCHKTEAQLVNLQGWVREQRQEYLARCKQLGGSCN